MAKKAQLTPNVQTEQKTTTAPPSPVLPEVRSVPTWPSNAQIPITGQELESIQHSVAYITQLQHLTQGLISRGIIDGVISIDFEKLNSQTLQYEQMTDEEKAPYLENFKTSLEKVRSELKQKENSEPKTEA